MGRPGIEGMFTYQCGFMTGTFFNKWYDQCCNVVSLAEQSITTHHQVHIGVE